MQVPQFLLEHASLQGAPCYALCCQPRRISAVGVAERVAAERGERVGGVVGYSVRLDSKASADTCLLFCTYGILTRRLQDDATLCGVTHIFIDEVGGLHRMVLTCSWTAAARTCAYIYWLHLGESAHGCEHARPRKAAHILSLHSNASSAHV